MENKALSANRLKTMTKAQLNELYNQCRKALNDARYEVDECRATIVEHEKSAEEMEAAAKLLHTDRKVYRERHHVRVEEIASQRRDVHTLQQETRQLRAARRTDLNTLTGLRRDIDQLAQEKTRLIDALSLIATSASVDAKDSSLHEAHQRGFDAGQAFRKVTKGFGPFSHDQGDTAEDLEGHVPFHDLGAHGSGS